MFQLRWLVLCMAVCVAGCGGTFIIPAGCDGAGCACTVPEDCSTGFTCAGVVCVSAGTCSAASPRGSCPGDRLCEAGACVNSSWCQGCTAEQGCQDGQCVTLIEDNICSPENLTGLCPMGEGCVQGTCIVITTSNACSPERTSGLCPDGAACFGGACIPISENACSPSALTGLCPNGLKCNASGTCQQPACSPSTLFGYCAPNTYCSVLGSCISQGLCEADGDCGRQHICEGSTCLRDFSCNATGDCLGGEFCTQNGQCLPDGNCTHASQCEAGERCSAGGECKPSGTCESSQDCTAPQTCGSGGTCLSPNACTSINDCPPGHACQNGDCNPAGTLCTATSATPTSCPNGETCCGLGQLCSSAGSCISSGRCVTDADCLAGYQVCGSNHNCQATTPCAGQGDCGEGEKCGATATCIASDNCLIDLDCDQGEICNALFDCVPNDSCGVTEFQTTLVKPNMLIVLDRSGSMNQCVSGTDTRWEQALIAINQVVEDNSDKVRFGLSTYPSQCPGTSRDNSECNNTGVNGCPLCNFGTTPSNQGTANCPAPSNRDNNRNPGKVDITIGESTEAGIDASLAANFPGGRTPTGPTLRNIRDNNASFGLPSSSDTVTRGNYILLITDGEPNEDAACSNDARCVNAALETLRNLNPPVTTFVVGFAFEGGASVSPTLNCNAVFGGTSLCAADQVYPRPVTTQNPQTCTGGNAVTRECYCSGSSTTPCYYDAGNAAALTTKFEQIVGQVASCTYSLDSAPPDINRLYVFLDYGAGDPVSVPRGAGTWDYNDTTNQVSLFGTTCSDVQNGTATTQVVYGCPTGGG